MNCPKRSLRSGFTLVEVMVLSVVSLMLIGLLAQVFITATRRTEDARLRVDVQQNALLVLGHFQRDLAKTSLNGLAALDGDPYVLTITPATYNANPGVSWGTERYAYVHLPSKKTIHREIVPPENPSFPSALTPLIPPSAAQLSAIGTNHSGRERILSSYVEEFALSDRNDRKTHFQTQALKLEMTLRRPLSTSERYAEFTVVRRYTLRNNF